MLGRLVSGTLLVSTLVGLGTTNEHPIQHASSQEIAAFHRSGQTFLTWAESTGTTSYLIYRHTTPLGATTLAPAQLIAEVPQGSGIFWTERARAVDPNYDDAGYESLRNYVITDLGPQLPDGTGLFVWATHENGSFYYSVRSTNSEQVLTTGPIAERVSDPEPVLIWQSDSGLSRVYTQFMDYATYNPTFDAPRPGNSWMGLPEWEELSRTNDHQQYAYNYWVGLPTPETCGGDVWDQVPLIVHIEGWGSRYTAPASAPYWCAVHLWGDDPNQSWYFGFSATHDYRTDLPVTSGPIVNYTEARLIRAIHETIRNVSQPAIDPNRIYVYGHSMGGTGALMLAERYPEIIAAAAASEPMMNFAAAAMWIDELEGKWGAHELNLPVDIRGPDAASLESYQGTGVWDWQNLGAQLAVRRGDEMAFIAIAHGTLDTVIDWQTVARPSYTCFYEGNRAFIGELIAADHTWLGFRDHPNWNFNALNLKRDESFPALANASGSAPIPPDGPGGFNMTLEWSASWNNFAGPPVDLPGEWSVALRSLDGEQTVTVTPRRLQQFKVIPTQAYRWQNTHLDTNTIIQDGVIVPDEDGLLVIEGVRVDQDGSRLVLRPAP